MSVQYFGPGRLSSGFVGFMVSGYLNGKSRSRYFPTGSLDVQSDDDMFFRHHHLQANKLDAEWQLESLELQYRRYVTTNYPTTQPDRGVGVHGLTASFAPDRAGRWRACFNVALIPKDDGKKTGVKTFTFTEAPYSQVWKDAVEFWAEEHDIRDADRDRVISNAPPPEQFKRIRRLMNEKKGVDIPVAALSPVFAEQRREIELTKSLETAKRLEPVIGGSGSKRKDERIEAEMAAWFYKERTA